MSKKIIGLLLAALLCLGMAQAPTVQEKAGDIFIDDFEHGAKATWWTFDSIWIDDSKGFLEIEGEAENWYCGGIGTYLAKNCSGLNRLVLDIKGSGFGSGIIKIELYDDDKGSWETAFDENWMPLKDDIWSREIRVDWEGWQTLTIPFTGLGLSNPGKGDGILNLGEQGSGNLLQIQFVFIAPSKEGEVNLGLDDIYLE